MPRMENKIIMRPCKIIDPKHPCDPPRPCGICDDPEGQCPKPTLCLEKLRNPYLPHQTKCKPGASIGVEACRRKDPTHPCDPPPPCIPGKPRQQLCPEVALCKEKVKNLESPIIHCHPDPEDFFSRDICENAEQLKIPIPECPKVRCPPLVQLDPFAVLSERKRLEAEKEKEKKDTSKDYLYSKDICANLDLLKQKIKDCFKPRCSKQEQLDPFADEAERRRLKSLDKVEDPCALKKR